MDRNEFMELVYETFADEPDNVLANGIIEAADAYVEHEKAQLSKEDTTSGTISRQAVKHLDLFTKTFCRDKSVKDDLVFRCKQCEFGMPDGKCLVKVMARKLCPDYKDFGAMGDL